MARILRLTFAALIGAFALITTAAAATSRGATGAPEIVYLNWQPDMPGTNSDIYMMHADGTDQRNISKSPLHESGGYWSPDGRTIAFNARRVGDKQPNHIYTMRADGSARRRLTSGTPTSFDAWSPDGRRILFTRWGKKSELWSIAANGRDPRRLTRNSVDDWGPSWSRDQRSIVYTREVQQGQFRHYDVFVMKAQGGAVRRVTRTGDSEAAGWSPDGRQIAFIRRGDSEAFLTPQSVFVSNADGSGARLLIKIGGHPDGVRGVVWSPDGSWLLVAAPGIGLVRVSTNGDGHRWLTRNKRDTSPVLSPDGREIAFKRKDAIWMMTSDGANAHRLTHPELWHEHVPTSWTTTS
jgi:Tol biopolymer transport system component